MRQGGKKKTAGDTWSAFPNLFYSSEAKTQKRVEEWK